MGAIMWQDWLDGLCRGNVESLDYHRQCGLPAETVDRDISEFVAHAINTLPRHFALPVKLMGVSLNWLCLLGFGDTLGALSPERRRLALRSMQRIPFFGMMNKLVRAMAFLRLFGRASLAPEAEQNAPLQEPPTR